MQYDIEGLAEHVDDGMATLGVIMLVCMFFGFLEWTILFYFGVGCFILIAIIIPLGAQKFTPYFQNLAKENPDDAKHARLKKMLSEEAFARIKSQTKLWLVECGKCHHKYDAWRAGYVRSGVGEPRNLNYCKACGKWSFHKLRKKTEQEAIDIP